MLRNALPPPPPATTSRLVSEPANATGSVRISEAPPPPAAPLPPPPAPPAWIAAELVVALVPGPPTCAYSGCPANTASVPVTLAPRPPRLVDELPPPAPTTVNCTLMTPGETVYGCSPTALNVTVSVAAPAIAGPMASSRIMAAAASALRGVL